MKRISPFFLVCLFIVSLLCFSSCASTDVPAETTDTVETTSTTETTEPQDTAWKPDPSMWWLYTPACAHEEKGHIDDEIKLTLEESVFAEAPEELLVTIRNNKTPEYPGEPMFYISLHGYFEKIYPSYEIGYGIDMGFPYSMWVRLPIAFGRNAYFASIPLTEPEFTMNFPFASAVQDETLELTPGRYRLVVFAGDGPHYAYFEITG